MKNKLIFGGLVVLATIIIMNQAKKDANGIFAKLTSIGS